MFIQILFSVLASTSVAAASCASTLRFTSIAGVESVLRQGLTAVKIVVDENPAATDETDPGDGVRLHALRDDVSPDLLRLEAPHGAVNLVELETARDLATWTSSTSDRKFVFVPDYKRRSVPKFDGVEIDPDGTPRANVSLKAASFRVPSPDRYRLWQSLEARLHRADRDCECSLGAWYRMVTGVQTTSDKKFVELASPDRIEAAVTLASLFGLGYPAGAKPPGFHLVLDMRYSGYEYDFVSGAAVLRDVRDVVSQELSAGNRFTMIWGPDQALTFESPTRGNTFVERSFGETPRLQWESDVDGAAFLHAMLRSTEARLATMRYRLIGRPDSGTIRVEHLYFAPASTKYAKGLETFLISGLRKRYGDALNIEIDPPGEPGE